MGQRQTCSGSSFPDYTMQKSLLELAALSPDELSKFIDRIGEPLLVTRDGEPQFVAQSLAAFEAMVRRIRALETERNSRHHPPRASNGGPHGGAKIIPFRP
jgi:hypothetical protein